MAAKTQATEVKINNGLHKAKKLTQWRKHRNTNTTCGMEGKITQYPMCCSQGDYKEMYLIQDT